MIHYSDRKETLDLDESDYHILIAVEAGFNVHKDFLTICMFGTFHTSNTGKTQQ